MSENIENWYQENAPSILFLLLFFFVFFFCCFLHGHFIHKFSTNCIIFFFPFCLTRRESFKSKLWTKKKIRKKKNERKKMAQHTHTRNIRKTIGNKNSLFLQTTINKRKGKWQNGTVRSLYSVQCKFYVMCFMFGNAKLLYTVIPEK